MPIHKVFSALRGAADALHDLRRQTGWGFNRATAADADSTAWALRFLALIDDLRDVCPLSLLGNFIDRHGHAHTFRGVPFGSWAGAHEDVTPNLGLALVASGAPSHLIELVRSAVLSQRPCGAPWRSYWWATDTYAVARNLEFLRISGEVPSSVFTATRHWIASQTPRSAFEAAQLLAGDTVLNSEDAVARVQWLARSQRGDGSWEPATMLLVPPQHSSGAALAYADENGSFTTAMVLHAIKSYVTKNLRSDHTARRKVRQPL